MFQEKTVKKLVSVLATFILVTAAREKTSAHAKTNKNGKNNKNKDKNENLGTNLTQVLYIQYFITF